MNNKYSDAIRQENMSQYGFGPHAMNSIKICNDCGHIAPASELFCRECGKPLPKKTLFQSYKGRHKHCSYCGTVLTNSSEYCPQCGTKIN